MAGVFGDIEKRIEAIGNLIGLNEKEKKVLLAPEKIHKATLVIEGEEMPAWRVVFNSALGPGKGGIRFHPDVSEDEVKSLSFWMSIKNSLAGLPYGGGKGGVKFNPKGKSEAFLEKVSRAYVDAFYGNLGSNIDIPAPDVYTNSQIMAWMLDQYEKKTGYHDPGMITGKPVELGGLAMRTDATAKGGFIIINELLHHYDLPQKPTVAIQGFGNAGSYIAKMLFGSNFKIVAVSDSKGGVLDEGGIDINRLDEIKADKGTVTASACKQISNEDLLLLPVDILVLAALENQITKKNADKIRAKFVVELANGPVSFDADKVLAEKGITVLPDILANSGGVIVSYFEWCQNRAGNVLDNSYLENKFSEMMKSSWHTVYDYYKDNGGIDIRTSAYVVAVKKILQAQKFRGRV